MCACFGVVKLLDLFNCFHFYFYNNKSPTCTQAKENIISCYQRKRIKGSGSVKANEGTGESNERNRIAAKGIDKRMGDKRLGERGTQQAVRGARSKKKRARGK